MVRKATEPPAPKAVGVKRNTGANGGRQAPSVSRKPPPPPPPPKKKS